MRSIRSIRGQIPCAALDHVTARAAAPGTRELIQVSQNLAQPATREGEVRALTDALRGLGLARGLILTDANTEPLEDSGLTIEVRPLAEWLLQG